MFETIKEPHPITFYLFLYTNNSLIKCVFVYILSSYIFQSSKNNKNRPPDWPFFLLPGGQETVSYLRVALYARD